MKFLGILFIIVLLAAVILPDPKGKRAGSSQKRMPRPASQAVSASQSHTVVEQIDQTEDPGLHEAGSTTRAEQVLEDSSEGNITEMTHDFQQSLSKLDDICSRVESISESLLSAGCVTERHEEQLTQKEATK